MSETLQTVLKDALGGRFDPKEKPLFNKNCHDCGQFLKRELWVAKNHPWKKHALCSECFSNYDDPMDM